MCLTKINKWFENWFLGINGTKHKIPVNEVARLTNKPLYLKLAIDHFRQFPFLLTNIPPSVRLSKNR
jgi:hypothetical protein